MSDCVMCGENKATTIISDPNDVEGEDWGVCVSCKDFIGKGQAMVNETLIKTKFEGKSVEQATKESMEKYFPDMKKKH